MYYLFAKQISGLVDALGTKPIDVENAFWITARKGGLGGMIVPAGGLVVIGHVAWNEDLRGLPIAKLCDSDLAPEWQNNLDLFVSGIRTATVLAEQSEEHKDPMWHVRPIVLHTDSSWLIWAFRETDAALEAYKEGYRATNVDGRWSWKALAKVQLSPPRAAD